MTGNIAGPQQDLAILEPISHKVFGYAIRRRGEIPWQEADKLIRLFHNLWFVLRMKDKSLIQLPGLDMNDKHGTRLASPTTDPEKPKAVLDVMEFFSNIGSGLRKIVTYKHKSIPYGHEVTVESHIEERDLFELKGQKAIHQEDIDQIEDLIDALSYLTEREIISLGRHQAPDHTADQIGYEIDAWKEACQKWMSYVSTNISSIRASRGLVTADKMAWEARSFASEIMNKSLFDSSTYLSGYAKILAYKKTGSSVPSALRIARQPAASIWEDVRVTTMQFIGILCHEFSTYFWGVFHNADCFEKNRSSAKRRGEGAVVDRAMTQSAYENLRILLTYRKDTRPIRYNHESLEKDKLRLSSYKPLIDDIADPNGVWEGNISLEDFVGLVDGYFAIIDAEYLGGKRQDGSEDKPAEKKKPPIPPKPRHGESLQLSLVFNP